MFVKSNFFGFVLFIAKRRKNAGGDLRGFEKSRLGVENNQERAPIRRRSKKNALKIPFGVQKSPRLKKIPEIFLA